VNCDTETVLNDLGRIPLSKSLRRALTIAQHSENSDFALWCQLELGGYLPSNPWMTRETTIPVYRSVAGHFTDVRGKRVDLPPGQHFSVIQLRNGIEELEVLRKNGLAGIHDVSLCQRMREQFQVEVHLYHLNTLQLTGIFSAVRFELWMKLSDLHMESSGHVWATREGILKALRYPDWFGANLRALLSRRKGTSKA
jgi:AbiTii